MNAKRNGLMRSARWAIVIDYSFRVVCTEAELLGRMGRLRERLLTLPFESVSPVIPVDPAYRSNG